MKSYLVLFILIPLASCSPPVQKPQAPVFKQGLGEMMNLIHMRQAKLGLAGMNENWPLAAYELDRLKEGFDEVVASHPVSKDAPQPIATLLPAVMSLPLAQLQEAVAARSGKKFIPAYDLLTSACNGCHQAENHGYIVIKQPDPRTYPNQDFLPKR